MAEADRDGSGRLVLDKPRWSQDTFNGRAKHFFNATNPLNLLTTNQQLDAAKLLIEQYKLAIEPAGTTEEKVWSAKYLYDSAFHPETREKQMLIGRMSAQVPMNMTITGAMMTFYKTNTAVIFWQWLNQSFNAVVNYTNRSGDIPIPTNTLLKAYLSATGAALGVGLGLNAMVKTLPPIVGRFVPFACVASANCVNIPLMRQREIIDGIPVFDENGNRLGESKIAATRAVQMTVFSRVVMAMPGMSIPPLVMSRLEEKPFMKRMPWLASPIQIGLVGFILCFATPLCCAIFPQTSSLDVDKLEPELRESIGTKAQRVYFNKGL